MPRSSPELGDMFMSTLHTFKSVRRRKLALTALALLASAPVVQAQSSGSYPNRPIRLVVGYPPGGSSDATARLLGAALSIKLGQPVIIDNKPGANTAIAAQYAKTQPVFKNPQCHPLEGPTEKGPEKSGRNGAERAHRETRIGLEPA